MQIVSSGDNLHEMSNLISGKNKKNIIDTSSALFAYSVLMVKGQMMEIKCLSVNTKLAKNGKCGQTIRSF